MRRSAHVVAPLLASAAVAVLSGCHGPEMQRCVDANNHVVDPVFCRNLPANQQQPVVGGATGGFYPGYYGGYHFYYGGGGSYAPGSIATGGSISPASGHSYSTTSGTARGGFGSSFGGEGHGGGAGE